MLDQILSHVIWYSPIWSRPIDCLIVRRTRLSTVGDRPGFSVCCLSCLERSATARHGCRISACLLQSPQDSSLQALLSVTSLLMSCPRSDCVIPDTLIVFVIYLLTYLLLIAFSQQNGLFVKCDYHCIECCVRSLRSNSCSWAVPAKTLQPGVLC